MSDEQTFQRLAPFIRDYIHRNGWTELRDIQKRALPAILDTQDHILIMSGTASGKTEAAMLPVLTLLDATPATSVGVLYIGPLKALINDQFDRIQALLQDHEEIPIQGWHGDIPYGQKQRFLKKPRGVLQITPESMEALFARRYGELKKIFGDLRFIIIDEIHAFLGTERGQQVLCHLQRLEGLLARPVRRIGLSATIGDTSIALKWLESSTHFNTRAVLVEDMGKRRTINLNVNHFVIAQESHEFQAEMAPMELGSRRQSTPGQTRQSETVATGDEQETGPPPVDIPDELQKDLADYYDHLFKVTKKYQKTLIFTNRRNKAERIASELRQRLTKVQPDLDWYVVHHSSIAADLRAFAEAQMREADRQACAIATASLELGIDIGHLDITVQVEAPNTVSSFVQRLGRSGRRGKPSSMVFYTLEYMNRLQEASTEVAHIPWNFLQTIAIVQVYCEAKWIEPAEIPRMPLSLLYQQTMSVLLAHTERKPAQLLQAIRALAAFKEITQDDYRLFLQHLLARDQIARMDEGTLIVGMKGEQTTSQYDFYATFASPQEYTVMAGVQAVGMIEEMPSIESVIGLAGYAWRVLSVDEGRRTVHVERAQGKVKPNWLNSGTRQVHAHVVQRLRKILQEETVYGYLTPLARERLALARQLANRSRWLESNVVRLPTGQCIVFPWTGWRIYQTLVDLFEHQGWASAQQQSIYYIEIKHQGTAKSLLHKLHSLSTQVPEMMQEIVKKKSNAQLWRGKYDHFAPRLLLEKAYIQDVVDVEGTVQWLADCE